MTEGLDIDAFRERLRAMRDELDALEASSAEARGPVELDQTRQGRLSRMDALQGQAMARATSERRAVMRRRIDAALARIEAGDYGACAVCDEPIAPARLENDPAAPTCINCAGR